MEEIKKTPKKTYAPLLYDLTELQREARVLLQGGSVVKALGWKAVYEESAWDEEEEQENTLKEQRLPEHREGSSSR